MDDCIFCRIASGEIPTTNVYEDERVLAFYDMAPQAAVHVLVIPKAHADSLAGAEALPDDTLAALLRAVGRVAQITGVDQTGFRVIANAGADACQTVNHLHMHVLGGEKLPERLV